jgi:hypothetical protein
MWGVLEMCQSVALQDNNRGGGFKILYLGFWFLKSLQCLRSLSQQVSLREVRVVNSWIDSARNAVLSNAQHVISKMAAPAPAGGPPSCVVYLCQW